MTTFEFLSVFISIVMGLAVVRVLAGLVSTVTREGVKRYWVYTTWLLFFVGWLPYFWWFTFDWRLREVWTFPVFFFVVFYAMLVYVTLHLLVPDRTEEPEDYEAFFFKIRRRFFRLFVLIIVVDAVDSVLKGAQNLEGLGATFFPVTAVYIFGHTAASLTDNRRYHAAWVIAFFAMIVFFSLGFYADVFGRD